MTLNHDIEARRLCQIERRLNQIGSSVKGNQSFQADRIADVMEQIEELRQVLNPLVERVERMAEFLNTLKANGES